MANTVPKECPAPGCNATFFDARDQQERLTTLKQHLYRDHMDEMPREDLAKIVDALPSMDELQAPAPGSAGGGTHAPSGWGSQDELTPPGF